MKKLWTEQVTPIFIYCAGYAEAVDNEQGWRVVLDWGVGNIEVKAYRWSASQHGWVSEDTFFAHYRETLSEPLEELLARGLAVVEQMVKGKPYEQFMQEATWQPMEPFRT